MFPAADRERLSRALSKNEAATAALNKRVAAALKAGPWSVTYQRPEGVKIGPNDYFSEGPYWWPDPKNPGGPYIRKDGEHNPKRFMGNRGPLGEVSQAVFALGMGNGLLGDKACADRAAHIISVWFIDPKTRMNPNLEYGQAIRGVTTGRGIGIIDTVGLIHAAQGIALLQDTGQLDKGVAEGVRRWYADYLRWMTTSEKGLDEKKTLNNHATYWTAQVAAYASLVGDEAQKKVAWEHYRTHLVPTQIQPDGSCPQEEARTRSLSYSLGNLDGFAILCRIADMNGVSLWRYRTPKGTGVEKAFHYMMPYALKPESWAKAQITPERRHFSVFLGLAGQGLRSQELLAAYRQLPPPQDPWGILIDLIVSQESS